MNILTKTTNYVKSISLTQPEFDACLRGEYDKISVSSRFGKHIRDIPKHEYSRRVLKAQIDLVNHDPDGKHYWIVNI